jgi:citrate lyase subunit beta/citryl-CoA lyase|tara:strand:+ start:2679 stop:3551 length:873 start_codon:yes stop_codon:yes gene_type:complete
VELFRSLLFVPGNRSDMLEKASTADTDILVPDMEDSVPDNEKSNARSLISEKLETLSGKNQSIVPRVNALDTGLTFDDIHAVVNSKTYGISVGKIESSWDIKEVSKILSQIESEKSVELGSTKIIAWIESASAIVNVNSIASASDRMLGIAFGGEDFTNDMGIQRSETGIEILYPRSVVAVAAKAAGITAIDTPYVNFRDNDGLEQEIKSVLPLGFKAKFAIHPGQLQSINNLFSPSEEAIEYAKKVIEVFEEAERNGSGATSLDGKMIDVPVVKRARNLLELANRMSQS